MAMAIMCKLRDEKVVKQRRWKSASVWSLVYTNYNKQDRQTASQPASSRPNFQGTFGRMDE